MTLWAIAVLLFLGSLIDVAVLWLGQRQSSPQWEYAALVNTLEGMWGPVLAVALAYLALHLGGLRSLWGYRSLAIVVIALGAVGAVMGGLLATDYFVLKSRFTADSAAVFNAATLKGLALAGLYTVILVPLGATGLRAPRSRR
jgi:hypothetical protein